MSGQGHAGSSWVSQVAILTAGGLLGMTALAAIVVLVISALATNVMIWFLILPYLVGGPTIWTITIGIFLAIGIGTCLLAYVASRALWNFVQRRIRETNDGVQVRTGQP